VSALLALALTAAGCQHDKEARKDPSPGAEPELSEADAGGQLDTPVDDLADAETPVEGDPPEDAAETAQAPIPGERAALCARPADDAVRDIFCKGARLSVSSLRELETRLELSAIPVDMDEATAAAIPVDPTKLAETAVFLGHSTALSGQLVSAINPRAILLNQHTLIAFQRGAQKVEIATRDRQLERRNFYLVTFKQACNERPAGCLPGDLYTLSIERDWSSVTLEDDEDIKNTPNDCRQCHQRKLPQAQLLMRELVGPWTHFFFPDNELSAYNETGDPSGRGLTRGYVVAKGSESYAGVPSALIRQTVGLTLQKAVQQSQPLQFPTAIEDQVESNLLSGGTGRSGLWDVHFAAFKRGAQLALPHYKPNPADPAKQAALSDAYARYRRGELAAAALPDLADIFPDDPQQRAEIGLQTEPSAGPSETLIQACGSCHNDVLDQSLSRARFNIRLASMTREELDLALARIELPESDARVMPPKGMRQLDPEGKTRLLTFLKENQRSLEDDVRLEAAAKDGMATGYYGYAGF
jgi:cytochrome c553